MFPNVSTLPLEFWAPGEQNVPLILNEGELFVMQAQAAETSCKYMDQYQQGYILEVNGVILYSNSRPGKFKRSTESMI